jgi:hypothetical protein
VLLAIIFWLMLQHTEIPEFVWGNAISSSRASAETQMAPFVKYIQKRQGQAAQWLIELAQVVVGYLSLWESGVQIENNIKVQWQSLTDSDGRLTLDALKLGMDKSLIDDETALGLMPLDIDNPADVLRKARKQEQQRQEETQRRQDAWFDLGDNDPDDDEEDEPDDVDEMLESVFGTVLEAVI